jgi:hypothetical protein
MASPARVSQTAPTVRFEGQYRAGGARHFLDRNRRDPGGIRETRRRRRSSGIPSWCAWLLMLSLSNTIRAFNCAFAFVNSASVIPCCRTRSSSSSRTASIEASGVPSVAVADTV